MLSPRKCISALPLLQALAQHCYSFYAEGCDVAGFLFMADSSFGDHREKPPCPLWFFRIPEFLSSRFKLYYLLSTGYLFSTHSFQPPFRAFTLVKPLDKSSCATRALVCSAVQEQYRTISLFFGSVPAQAATLFGSTRFEHLIV